MFIIIAIKKLGIHISEELEIEAMDSRWINLTQNVAIIPRVIILVTK
jgi:hypothetical protein